MAKRGSNDGLIVGDEMELVAEGLVPDSKNRISLTRAVREEGVHYNVYRNRKGQIVLDPQKSVPAYEAWVFENPEALASVKIGLRQAAAGKIKKAVSSARHSVKDR